MTALQMLIVFLKILLPKVETVESRSDFVASVKAALDQFVDEVPVYAKKQ